MPDHRPSSPVPEHADRGAATGPPPLLVVPWVDPVVDDLGVDPRSSYAEQFWLPVLGPTATWFVRRIATELDRQPDGFSVQARTVARSIGIGTRGGRHSPFHRSIDRCIRFGLAHRADHDILAVRRRLPPLSKNQVDRLPRPVRDAHRDWQRRRRADGRRPDAGHATRLARSLLDVGADEAEVEEQLRRWGFDGAAVRRALRSACSSPRPQIVS